VVGIFLFAILKTQTTRRYVPREMEADPMRYFLAYLDDDP
jgi:hypothetical protein